MTDLAAIDDDMLRALAQCAYRMGLRFSAEAEAAEGRAMLEAYERFDRCFFSVRMGIALRLRLRKAEPVRREPEAEVEIERSEHEPADHRPEPAERDRERETERASLPRLLAALQSVADDAATLPGPPPAELVTLDGLLARFASAPAAALDRPAGALRTRLAATSASSVLTAPPVRHATGPPRR